MKPATIYVDARCFQDDDYRFRGVGQHASSVLSQAREVFADHGGVRLTALLDRTMEPVAPEHSALFDAAQYAGYVRPGVSDWFLSLSPMTHAPLFTARLLTRAETRSAAIVYDFIPHEEPERYLPTDAARIGYLNNLSWLKQYDLYLPISNYSGTRIAELLGVDPGKVRTSGVAVRDSVISSSPDDSEERGQHILFVGGGDARKNADCVVMAHGASGLLQRLRIPLEIVGNYPEDMKRALLALHARTGGAQDLVHFRTGLSDFELASLYRDAVVTVCPSRTEGFSIPVVEANANGCPVIISNCPAQTELIPFPEDQFDPDDHPRVTRLIEAIAADPVHRARVIARQKDIWRRFEAKAVGERFWKPFLETAGLENILARDLSRPASPAIARGAKPKIAFVTPLPPDKSGVADYTAACLESLAKSADIHVFTETKNPAPSSAYAAVEPLSPLPYLSRRYDAVVSVIGNSHFHLKTLDLLLDYGGAAIAHDARMINFYSVLHGPERAAAIASRELGRSVTWPEIEPWLHNQRKLPTLFLSEILETASPTIVHSKVTQNLIQKLYNRPTSYIPFSVYRRFPEGFLTPAYRRAARDKLGIDHHRPVIAVFGAVTPDKVPEECIWSMAMLKRWRRRADLWFVGGAPVGMREYLHNVSAQAGVTGQVHLFDDLVSEETYLDFLAATDVSLAFRAYGLGGLSGGLLDCIAGGVPTVANTHLAEAMNSPEFVLRSPDGISPVLIAELIELSLQSRRYDAPFVDQAMAYRSQHSFGHYGRILMHALGLGQRVVEHGLEEFNA